MIEEYFEYRDWEDLDLMIISLYDVILRKRIGDFDKGSYFKMITVDIEDSVIRLTDKEDNEVEYFINYSFSEH